MWRHPADALCYCGHEKKELIQHGHLDFSILFFGSDDDNATLVYDLLLAACVFSDQHGFKAVWLPERHFDSIGPEQQKILA